MSEPTFATRAREALERAAAAVRRAAVALVREAGPAITDPIEAGFRRITGGKRDLTPISRQRAAEVAYYLYLVNPTARRVTELLADFVIGSAWKHSSSDPEIEKLVTKLWGPDYLALDTRLYSFALELGLFGEQVFTVFVGADGLIRLGRLDPSCIVQPIPDPENVEEISKLVVRVPTEFGTDGKATSFEEKTYDVLSQSRLPSVEDIRKWASKPDRNGPLGVFYWRVNHVSSASRGYPDLLPVLDWIDAHDQLVFNAVERSALMNMALYVVEVKGGPEAVKQYADDVRKQGFRPGMVRFVPMGSVKWTPSNIELKETNNRESADLARRQILTGIGVPEHWLAEGGDVNRATAAEMGDPVYRRLVARQGGMVHEVRTVFRLAVRCAMALGWLKGEHDENDVQLHPDEVRRADRTAKLGDLKTLGDALLSARTAGVDLGPDGATQAWRAEAEAAGVKLPELKETSKKQGGDPRAPGSSDQTPDAEAAFRAEVGRMEASSAAALAD